VERDKLYLVRWCAKFLTTYTLSHTHTHTLFLSHTHTHKFTHTLSLSLTHTLKHTLSLSHTHTLILFLNLSHTRKNLQRKRDRESARERERCHIDPLLSISRSKTLITNKESGPKIQNHFISTKNKLFSGR